MKYLISETTKEERIAIVKKWIPLEDGIEDNGDMDLWEIYDEYIKGNKEISEINEEMSGVFYTEEDLM